MTFRRAKRLRTWLSLIGLAGLSGCITPGAERIKGPDGTPMLHVHCGADQSQCFRLAGESCPHGYDYAPVYAPEDGNFFVRCRNQIAAVLPAPAAPAPAPIPSYLAPSYAATPPAATPAPAADWPPSEVGRATEPWNKEPAVVSGGAPSTALPPTPRTKFGEVDIGY